MARLCTERGTGHYCGDPPSLSSIDPSTLGLPTFPASHDERSWLHELLPRSAHHGRTVSPARATSAAALLAKRRPEKDALIWSPLPGRGCGALTLSYY